MLATETTTLCLNGCGTVVPPPRRQFCCDACGSAYRNRKAWALVKDVPVPERRRSFYTTPAQQARPDQENLRRVAFLEALDEITDTDVVNEILYSIDIWTGLLLEHGYKPTQAQNRATEIIAAFVWDGINLPKRVAG